MKLTTLDGSALAITRNIPARSEFEIHILEPVSKKSSLSFLATVFSANASDPDNGSLKQKLPT